MAHPGSEYDAVQSNQRLPNVQDLDVTVLAFAQWLSEMRARSRTSLDQMMAEMGIIRNGITSNNTDLTEFKRNTATVQQQMQSQISDLRDKLTDAYTEIANMKKTKSQFEQEVHAESQSILEQLQFKTLELETLKKAYAHTHQQLQQQIIQVQSETNEIRMKGDDAHRLTHFSNEQNVKQVSEVEMAAQYANNELNRVRSDHDSAISNLAENMNKWNDTLRDLSKEFHDFQKVMNVNHQRIQSSLWDVQAKCGIVPSGGAPVNGQGGSHAPDRASFSGGGCTAEPQRSPQQRDLADPYARPSGSPRGVGPGGQPGQPPAALRAQSPSAATGPRRATPQQPPMVPPYSAAPQGGGPPLGPPGAAYAVMR